MPLNIRTLTTNIVPRQMTGGILLGIVLLTVVDIIVDLIQGVELVHIGVEAAIIPLAALGLYLIWRSQGVISVENSNLKSDIIKISSEAAAWKAEARSYAVGLSEAIDSQLTRWGLSPAEKEVALLLLKGLSHKEIADVRKTSESTTRQQALSLYEKSGLEGRAQLAAFFLEDLLDPIKK